jgi:hypothetical protein
MKTALFVCSLCLVLAAPAAFAADAVGASPTAPATAAPADLASIFAAPGESVPGALSADTSSSCSATAHCYDGSTVSCSASGSSASCSGVDANCPSQRGYVTCTGSGGTTTTYCPICPPTCNIGCGSQSDPNAFCRDKCPLVCSQPWGFCNRSIGKCVCEEF